ncbi:3-hydroxydecanoyl-ACP dehydratase [Psychromonas sp. RZ22]|uniref:ApeP family dehydratase n=1 Tax=Psychromonas algarum TaxID=2555643 RepID=UPI001067F90C|nr:hotdog family protein [Psychromonas sp. RZ22]TEW54092.1 3-hydroxydecanoyl-ACP dehydratase [Psychromonas sp. RZ22]
MTNKYPSIASLVPHDAPMILIDNIVDTDEKTIHCQVFVTADSPFFDSQSNAIGAWVGIEYMAQTVAAWSGYQHFLKQQVSPIGFLLGVRRYDTQSDLFHQGEIIDIYAEKLMESEGMGAFSCQIKCKNKQLASAQLNVFVPNNQQLETMLKGKDND